MENEIIKTENVGAIIDATSINSDLLAQAIAKSTELKKMRKVMNLSAQYIELEKPSESFRGIYVGLQKMSITDKATGEMKSLTAARFIIEQSVYINAGAVLISELERAQIEIGTALEVTYERKEGNTKIYSITLLG
jgi:hypothetical protein